VGKALQSWYFEWREATVRSRSGKHPVLGALTITYGVVLCLSWVLALLGGLVELGGTWTAGEALAGLLFALLPLQLVVTGSALSWLHVGIPLRFWTTALAGVLLAAQAALVGYWTFNQLQYLDFLDMLAWAWAVVAFGLFVAVPSGAWALVLMGTAVSLSGGFSEARTSESRPWKPISLLGLLVLALMGLLGGISLLHIDGPGARNMSGLDGAWRDPAWNHATFRLRTDGKVQAVPHYGVIGAWSREGHKIVIFPIHEGGFRLERTEGTLEGGTIRWRDGHAWERE
jgi:hypothetical protein